MEEVREKRGLAYSVYSYVAPYKHSGTFGGGVATKNEEMVQSLDVIKAEITRMAKDGPTETELDNAKSYLTGSYALRFDTNAKIANQLLGIMVESLGIDYINKRNRADRCGDDGRCQAGRGAAAEGRGPDHHRRRQADGAGAGKGGAARLTRVRLSARCASGPPT